MVTTRSAVTTAPVRTAATTVAAGLEHAMTVVATAATDRSGATAATDVTAPRVGTVVTSVEHGTPAGHAATAGARDGSDPAPAGCGSAVRRGPRTRAGALPSAPRSGRDRPTPPA